MSNWILYPLAAIGAVVVSLAFNALVGAIGYAIGKTAFNVWCCDPAKIRAARWRFAMHLLVRWPLSGLHEALFGWRASRITQGRKEWVPPFTYRVIPMGSDRNTDVDRASGSGRTQS